jgi:hypothetical protein
MAIEFTHQQFLNVLFYKVFNKNSLGSMKLQIRCKSKQLSPVLVSELNSHKELFSPF